MEIKKYKIKEIASIYNGSTPSSSHPEFYDGKIIWFTPKDLSDQKSKYISKGERTITQKGYDSCSTTMIPAGNILMSSRAPIGLLAINKVDCCTNQGFKNFVVNQDLVDVEYLYYYLKQNVEYIKALGGGTTFSEISKTTLEEIELNLPSLPTQQRIAKVLTDIDNKIALNKKINKELEAMAKELYDYWFVQFDFPGADGKPYKSSGGKMVYNEVLKREIPEGWEVKKLGEYAEVKKGNLITEKDSKSGNIKVVAAGVDFSYLTDTPNRNKNVLTVSGSGANAGYINFWREPIFASDCTTIQFEKDINTILCHYGINFYQEYLMTNASGSAQPHVYPKQVTELPYILLPESLVNIVEKEFVSINSQISIFEQEIQHLTALRDELLPLLMNGQVSVK